MAGMDERYRAQREVALYYGYTDTVYAYAMLLSLWRFENGTEGNEAGHENKVRDAEVSANPCLSREANNYAKSARAMIRFTMEWVLKDEYMRKRWARDFAKWYHSGPTKDRNKEYASVLLTICREEKAKLRAGLYQPGSTVLE